MYILRIEDICVRALLSDKGHRIRTAFREDRDFSLYVLAGVCIGMATGIMNTVFNNYLNDVYHLTSDLRGAVEFPRELPGVAVMFVLGMLVFLGDVRLAFLAMAGCTLGLIGLGLLSPSFGTMLFWLILFSLGQHLYMPISTTIGMNLSRPEQYGSRLGLYSAYMLSATIVGYAVVWLGFRHLGMDYSNAFLLAALMYAMAGLIFLRMKKSSAELRKPRFVFRKKYRLYYAPQPCLRRPEADLHHLCPLGIDSGLPS